jgi:hypothetical protein
VNFGMGTRTITVWLETGDRVGDLTISDEQEISGCTWAPQTSSGNTTSRESDNQRSARVESGLVLFLPVGSPLTARHRVRLTPEDSTVWRVEGDPGVFHNPIGGTDEGVQVHLERVTG